MAAQRRAEEPIQVFGRTDSQPTRRCLRFFKERRMPVSFVDLRKRPPAPAELRRFGALAGVRSLLDESSPAYTKAGLGYLRMDDEEILERLRADPTLLRLPLVRRGAAVSVGVDEELWRGWHRDASR